MKTLIRIMAACVLVTVGAFLLVLLAAGFVEGMLLAASVLGLQHALGMDTQTSHNYAAVSGILPIIVTSFGFSGALVTVWHHHNCEQPRCVRLGHAHPETGRIVCRHHRHAPTP